MNQDHLNSFKMRYSARSVGTNHTFSIATTPTLIVGSRNIPNETLKVDNIPGVQITMPEHEFETMIKKLYDMENDLQYNVMYPEVFESWKNYKLCLEKAKMWQELKK